MKRNLISFVFAAFACCAFSSCLSAAEIPETQWSSYARANGLYETALGRLGSRFVLNPRPQDGSWHLSPLGTYFGSPGKMFLVVESGGKTRYLPFAGQGSLCEKAYQRTTMTSLSFICSDSSLPVDVTFSFISPFSPGDEKTSGAPFFYVKLKVKAKRAASGSVRVAYLAAEKLRAEPFSQGEATGVYLKGTWGGRHGNGEIFDSKRAAEIIWASKDKGISWVGAGTADTLLPAEASGFRWDFKAARAGEMASPIVAVAAYSAKQIMLMKAVYYKFKYTKMFASAGDVVKWALGSAGEIEKKRIDFDKRLDEEQKKSGVPSLPGLTAFSFQSWLMNTWWMLNSEGREWFSVWEGICKGHSTLDVAYNEGPLYLELWPGLLRMQLDEWPDFRRYPSIMPHDMGFGLNAGGQAMPHDMPVEENTNFILLLGAYWKKTGDSAAVKRHWPLVKKLADYIMRADTNGNGFADDGTANTIDSGIPATQYAPEQTYLAVKSLAALKFVTLMAAVAGDTETAPQCKEFMAKIRATLKKPAWMGDHFSVSIRHTVDFLDPRGKVQRDSEGNRVWDGEKDYQTLIGDIGGHLLGWNAHSIYSANGFYYLLRSGVPLPIDEELLGMFRKDLEHTAAETLQKYGSTHTDSEDVMWVSQNIWQDMTGAYLGIDQRKRTSRYWNLELELNRRPLPPGAEGGCFTDTYHYNADTFGLEYYPRGAVVLGWPSAWRSFNSVKIQM